MISDSFQFTLKTFENTLSKHHFTLDVKHNFQYGYIIEYISYNKRLAFTFDYKENTLYYYLIYGLTTTYPNDLDISKVVLFERLYSKFIPNVDLSTYQPRNGNYEEAINAIAKFINTFGSEFL